MTGAQGGGDASAPAVPPGVVTIGVLGGTFDPIHLGHLALARAARDQLGLDEVVFVPAGRPPHKPGQPIATGVDRLAMVELAIAGEPRFQASRVELDRGGPSYTVDTVEALLDAAAGAGRPADVTLILSAESFAGLSAWHEPDRLLGLARVAVGERPGHPIPSADWIRDRVGRYADRVVALAGPLPDVSASEIRARVAAGRPIDGLVPPAVGAWIEDHGLYRDAVARKDQA